MIPKHWPAVLVCAVLLILLACGSDDDPMSSGQPSTIEEVPRITVEALRAKIDNGDKVMIVDVRSEAEYDEAHIPGAVHIPYSDTISRLGEFPKDRDIVFYCT